MRANFPDSHLDALYKHLTSGAIDNPTASVQLSSFGGQVNAVAENATASSHRSSAFKMSWMLYWTEAADEAKSLAWIRDCYQEVYGDWRRAGAERHHRRLLRQLSGHRPRRPQVQHVKKKYDPRNVFRQSQSVRLPD
ncbi:BBE domain-containing protein [Streptomyces sp. NPDC019937]|uniref:BBE domain-containing protein n=1 Tax=Streptomyces sp. NPDC019937 TaxID=3154787 RepID=UPI0033FA966F